MAHHLFSKLVHFLFGNLIGRLQRVELPAILDKGLNEVPMKALHILQDFCWRPNIGFIHAAMICEGPSWKYHWLGESPSGLRRISSLLRVKELTLLRDGSWVGLAHSFWPWTSLLHQVRVKNHVVPDLLQGSLRPVCVSEYVCAPTVHFTYVSSMERGHFPISISKGEGIFQGAARINEREREQTIRRGTPLHLSLHRWYNNDYTYIHLYKAREKAYLNQTETARWWPATSCIDFSRLQDPLQQSRRPVAVGLGVVPGPEDYPLEFAKKILIGTLFLPGQIAIEKTLVDEKTVASLALSSATGGKNFAAQLH